MATFYIWQLNQKKKKVLHYLLYFNIVYIIYVYLTKAHFLTLNTRLSLKGGGKQARQTPCISSTIFLYIS